MIETFSRYLLGASCLDLGPLFTGSDGSTSKNTLINIMNLKVGM